MKEEKEWSPLKCLVAAALTTILGLRIHGVLIGAFFCLTLSTFALFFGLVPPWVAMIGMFLSLTVMICYVIRGTPEEKPDETPQKPPEITGAFDKFQFNKRK